MAEARLTLTVGEAAGLAGISRSLAYKLAREKKLPGVLQLGYRLVVSRSRFMEFLAGDGVGSSPPPIPSPHEEEVRG